MKRIFILEGADGCGKTTLAVALAKFLEPELTFVVHHGAYRGIEEISDRYFDSMIPAQDDLGNVILDRSWLSEPIYGGVYRNGVDRITPHDLSALTSAARTATVILCTVPWETCKENFIKRRAQEMLDDSYQLKLVYEMYERLPNDFIFDFTKQTHKEFFQCLK